MGVDGCGTVHPSSAVRASFSDVNFVLLKLRPEHTEDNFLRNFPHLVFPPLPRYWVLLRQAGFERRDYCRNCPLGRDRYGNEYWRFVGDKNLVLVRRHGCWWGVYDGAVKVCPMPLEGPPLKPIPSTIYCHARFLSFPAILIQAAFVQFMPRYFPKRHRHSRGGNPPKYCFLLTSLFNSSLVTSKSICGFPIHFHLRVR